MVKKIKKSGVKSSVKIAKKSAKKVAVKNIVDDVDYSTDVVRRVSNSMEKPGSNKSGNALFFAYLIVLVLIGVAFFLYREVQKIDENLKPFKSAVAEEKIPFQDTEAYKNLMGDVKKLLETSEKKSADNFVKYQDEVAALRLKVRDLEDNQQLYRGPYLVVLTMFNQLKLRVDAGDKFTNELRAIDGLNLSDKNISEFAKFAYGYSESGIDTLNELQNQYRELVMNASFAGKNSVSESPSFLQKLLYRVKGLVKIRNLNSDKNVESVDGLLAQISVSLSNGDLNKTVQQLKQLEKFSPHAFNVLKEFSARVNVKQKIDTDMSIIFSDLLKKIYVRLQGKNS